MGGVIDHDERFRVCPCVETHGPGFVAIADAINQHFGDALASGDGANAVDVEPFDYNSTIAASIRLVSGRRYAALFAPDVLPSTVVAVLADRLAKLSA